MAGGSMWHWGRLPFLLGIIVCGTSIFLQPAMAQGQVFRQVLENFVEKSREQQQLQRQSVPADPPPTAPSAEPPQSVAQGGEQLRLLEDTDLPYNDYRSGMEDPALKGIGLQSCIAYCEQDAQCRAFTYNQNARVCFLKSRAAEPERFRGAVSGIKLAFGDAPQLPAADPELSRALDREELAVLQKALNDAGYDAGPVDGQMGRRTRSAIADFLADNPGAGSGRVDVGLLLAVTGVVPPAREFEADSYRTNTIGRRLSLALVSRDRDLLADDRSVLAWLRVDRSDGIAGAAEQLAAYDQANDIEKGRLLAEYRDQLLGQADEEDAEPFRLLVSAATKLGGFDAETGMAVREPRSLFSERRLTYHLPRLDRDLVGIVPDLPESYSIPIETADEASALLDRVAEVRRFGRVDLVAYLTITDLGEDKAVSGASALRGDDVAVTVKLDRLELMLPAGRPAEEHPAERLALLVDTAGPLQAGPVDFIAAARLQRLPIVDDRLVLAGDGNSARSLARQFGGGDLTRLFDLAVLGLHPGWAKNALDDDKVMRLLSPVQRLRVFGDRDGSVYGLGNEFERRRAYDTFNNQIVPELLARAPGFPVPVLVAKQAQFGEYDFEAEAFPLQWSEPQRIVLVPTNYEGMQPQEILVDLPRSLPVELAEAERMRAERSSIYLVVTGSLAAEPQGQGYAIRFDAEAAKLQFSLDPETVISGFDVAELVQQPAERRPISVSGSDQPWAARYRIPVLDGRPLWVGSDLPGRQGLDAVAALFVLRANPSLFDRPGVTIALADALQLNLRDYLSQDGLRRTDHGDDDWAGVDEFEREDTRKRFVAENWPLVEAMLPTLPLEISMLRFAGVEEFERSEGAFPIARSGIDLSPGRRFEMALDGYRDDRVLLRKSEEEARAFREQLRLLDAPGLDSRVFGDTAPDLPPGTLATIETYRVDEVARQRGSNERAVLSLTPMERSLHPAADLTMRLADLPWPEVPRPAAPPVDVAKRTGTITPTELPEAPFDMLGITLGMPLKQARTILTDRLSDRESVPLRGPSANVSDLCKLTAGKLAAEIADAEPSEYRAIRETYLDDFARDDCARPELSVLSFGFGFDVPQERGGVDRIVVFKAPQHGDVVGAVIRAVPSELEEAMSNGLTDKYGNAQLAISPRDRFWTDEPASTGELRQRDECRRGLSDDSIPGAYLQFNCGAFIHQDGRRVLLIDTAYTSYQSKLITDRVAAAAAAAPKPMLDF